MAHDCSVETSVKRTTCIEMRHRKFEIPYIIINKFGDGVAGIHNNAVACRIDNRISRCTVGMPGK